MEEPSLKLVDRPLERARMSIWRERRDPLEHAYLKVLDSLNSAEEAERASTGKFWTGIKRTLLVVAESIQAEYKRGAQS